ncbi:hypothetical protein EVC23_021 [Rhizobium phage RHph_N3_8]|uniref:hypothetical protein n=1 Tax=Rhizobium phage RHph_N3_8 TaxID=2509748 RepID=UPI001AF425C0|nr:hypothetical protein QEJ65_gp21 [Rhizobium phage RHph_N3_8]QIG76020.1 hypothetical protein EVC23_021 [Rhizobium phage RHph_N3_8]
MEIIMWILGILSTGALAGIGFIVRAMTKQNEMLAAQAQSLALLVARVGTIEPAVIEKRLLDLETDMARVWGIYDAWRGPSSPTAVERLSTR